MPLESAFHQLLCLKLSFKLFTFLRVMQENKGGCFFCEHYVYYVFVFCILYVSCALFWTLDDDFSLSLRGCTGLTQA